MKHLWAPWRRIYFEKPKNKTCLFCMISKRKNNSRDYILYNGKNTFLCLNKFPYNPGHSMIVPYKHVENFEDLSDAELMEMVKILKICITAVKYVAKPDGFNIGTNIGKLAGAAIPHLHIHVVPRWSGDTNFMPVLADSKVLSDSLDNIWRELHQEIKKYSS